MDNFNNQYPQQPYQPQGQPQQPQQQYGQPQQPAQQYQPSAPQQPAQPQYQQPAQQQYQQPQQAPQYQPPQQPVYQPGQQYAPQAPFGQQDKVNVGLVILAVFFPIIGLIICFVKRKSSPKTAKAMGIAAGVRLGLGIIASILLGIFGMGTTAPHTGTTTDDTYQNEYCNLEFKLPDGFRFYSYEEMEDTLDIDGTSRDGVPYYEYENGNSYQEMFAESGDGNVRICVSYDTDEAGNTAEGYLDNYLGEANYAYYQTDYYTANLAGREFVACDFSDYNDNGVDFVKTVYAYAYDDCALLIEVICFEGASVPTWAYEYYFTEIGGATVTEFPGGKTIYGSFSGNTYTNDYFGIQYTTPKDFKFNSYDKMPGITNYTITDNYPPYIKYSDGNERYMDSRAYHDIDGDNSDAIITTACDFSCPKSGEEYLNDWREEDLDDSSHANVSEVYKVRVAGYEGYAFSCERTFDDGSVYKTILIKLGDGSDQFCILIYASHDCNISANELVNYFTAA